jgi:hypothetical protein
MAGREMLPSEVGASAEIGLPKMLQRVGLLDLNGILCRSRIVGLVSSIFRDFGTTASHRYRGINASYHGWGPTSEMLVPRREEKRGGRVKEDFMNIHRGLARHRHVKGST